MVSTSPSVGHYKTPLTIGICHFIFNTETKIILKHFKRTVTIIQSRIHRPKLRNKILIYTFALSFLPDLSGLESTTLVRIVICCMLILIICVQDSKDFADQKPLRITGPPDKVFK